MALQMSVLKKSKAGTPLFLLQCETRAKEQSKNVTILELEGMAEADVYCTKGRASILFAHPEV